MNPAQDLVNQKHIEHLFYGEYAKRQKILSNLTLEQVTATPSKQLHSIFAELWHTVLWQRICVTRDENLFEQTWAQGDLYPSHVPEKLEEWTALVEEFLSGIERALEWTETPEKLNLEVNPGETMKDILHSLAVHNAYHMGKIVALRQMMGIWETVDSET
jgi:uncharacterized damage-inducible protein DinB